ncbi:MAG: hypothetical protein Q8P22_04080 [Chloroflexota bacterium]|nr:hypothetical protein [Chloroflexota bacterium]
MANVRIDSQGVPKGPIYEETTPILHRSGLTAVDAADPTSASQGLDCAGYRNVRFDVDTTGSSGLTALKVQLLVWNATSGKYFRGAERSFAAADLAANPIPSLEAEVRGAIVFLKVVSATATSLVVSVYASLS